MNDEEIYSALRKYVIEDDFDFYAEFLNVFRFIGAKTKSDVLVAAIKLYSEIKNSKFHKEKFWYCMRHMHLYDIARQLFYGVKPKDILIRYPQFNNFEKENLVNFFIDAVSHKLVPTMIENKIKKL